MTAPPNGATPGTATRPSRSDFHAVGAEGVAARKGRIACHPQTSPVLLQRKAAQPDIFLPALGDKLMPPVFSAPLFIGCHRCGRPSAFRSHGDGLRMSRSCCLPLPMVVSVARRLSLPSGCFGTLLHGHGGQRFAVFAGGAAVRCGRCDLAMAATRPASNIAPRTE